MQNQKLKTNVFVIGRAKGFGLPRESRETEQVMYVMESKRKIVDEIHVYLAQDFEKELETEWQNTKEIASYFFTSF